MQAADWQWLRQLPDVVQNREERLPEVGRYNAGQKAPVLRHRRLPARAAAVRPRHLARLFLALFLDRRDSLASVVHACARSC